MKRLAFAATAACLSHFSFAIVATTSSTVTTPIDTTWTRVARVNETGGGISSAVAIGPRTFLSAQHVSASSITMLGTTYTIANQVTYSDATGGWDLRLINVTTDVPSYYGLAASATPGVNLTMVGYGYTGRVNSTGDGYITDIAPGIRHAGTNTLTDRFNAPGYGALLESYLDQAGQGAVSVGDSGGGFFDASGALMGIIIAQNNDTDIAAGLPTGAPAPPAPLKSLGFKTANPNGWSYHSGAPYNIDVTIAPGQHYFSSLAVDLTSAPVQTWIKTNSAVPEPSPLMYGALALPVLLLKKRK